MSSSKFKFVRQRSERLLAVIKFYEICDCAGDPFYYQMAERGWPIGSGAVESACRQKQCRRKCPGQFWTRSGLRHLDAFEEARDNGRWDELWFTT